MNAAARKPTDIPHEHRGDLYRDDEDKRETVARVRAHLRDAFPDMEVNVRLVRIPLASFVDVSITRCESTDLSDRDAGFAARRRVDAELGRFTRHDWTPNRGAHNRSMGSNVSIDPSLHAAALDDMPEVKPLVSFAEFTRTARPGDLLEHMDGKETHRGQRVIITAISSRRLTFRSADSTSDAGDARVPIQGGACFVSDGDLVCFKHSGFANQGGYSLVRWIRQQ